MHTRAYTQAHTRTHAHAHTCTRAHAQVLNLGSNLLEGSCDVSHLPMLRALIVNDNQLERVTGAFPEDGI